MPKVAEHSDAIYETFADEKVSIAAQIARIDDDFIKEFYSNHIHWYRRHAQINKRLFKTLTVFTIFFSLSITAASGLAILFNQEANVYILIVSALVTFANRITESFFLQEKYKRYRTTTEELRDAMNAYLFFISDADKEEPDKKKARQNLIAKIQAITNSEANEWKKEVTNIGAAEAGIGLNTREDKELSDGHD